MSKCKRFKKFGIIGTVFATLFAGLTFCGCTRFSDLSNEEKSEKIAGKVGWHMDMNDAQEAQVKEAAFKVFGYFDDYKKSRHETFTVLQEQIASDRMDTAKLNELYTKRREKFDTLVPKIIAELDAIHKTLNTEQKQKLISLLQKKQKRWSH